VRPPAGAPVFTYKCDFAVLTVAICNVQRKAFCSGCCRESLCAFTLVRTARSPALTLSRVSSLFTAANLFVRFALAVRDRIVLTAVDLRRARAGC